jgi:hypothetical protein
MIHSSVFATGNRPGSSIGETVGCETKREIIIRVVQMTDTKLTLNNETLVTRPETGTIALYATFHGKRNS